MTKKIALFSTGTGRIEKDSQLLRFLKRDFETRSNLASYLEENAVELEEASYSNILSYLRENREVIVKDTSMYPDRTVFYFYEKGMRTLPEIMIANVYTDRYWMIADERGQEYIQYLKTGSNGQMLPREGGRNTAISYLYRDASNYKVHNHVVVEGILDEQDRKLILDSLDEGLYFIPEQVGLPADKYSGTEDDHPWFELEESGFEITTDEPTIDLTAGKLCLNFRRERDRWKPERYM